MSLGIAEIIAPLLIIILVVALLRELITWWWKINQIVDLLKQMNRKLDVIGGIEISTNTLSEGEADTLSEGDAEDKAILRRREGRKST